MPKGKKTQSNFLNSASASEKALLSELSNVAVVEIMKPRLQSAFSNTVRVVISDTSIIDPPAIRPGENITPAKMHSISYRHNKDRLRLTTTLTNDQPGALRIRTVREDGETISTLHMKEAEIQVSPIEKIRLRTVLKTNPYQIPYSEWVVHDYLEQHLAQPVNQVRMKGVAKDHLESQWVYSNMRNAENEEILFQLIHDFLDVTLSVYDDQIEIVTDFLLGDQVIMLMKEHAPEMYSALEFNEELRYQLSEVLALLVGYSASTVEEEMLIHLAETLNIEASHITPKVNEVFYAIIEEYSVLMQSFKIQDLTNFVLRDTEKELILLSNLDDAYEQAVKHANLEVFLANKENSSLFLESCFKLNIQGESLAKHFEIGLNDSVASMIQSAVQLLVTQDVSDLVDGQIKDVAYVDFLGYIEDVLPIYQVLEKTYMDMLSYLEDEYHMELTENPIQYVLKNANGVESYELEYEYFEFLGSELLELFVKADRFDLFSMIFKDKPLILIDRLIEETFAILVEDEFNLQDTKTRLSLLQDRMTARIQEDVDIALMKFTETAVDEYTIERIEDSLILSSILFDNHYDLDFLEYRNLMNDLAGGEVNGDSTGSHHDDASGGTNGNEPLDADSAIIDRRRDTRYRDQTYYNRRGRNPLSLEAAEARYRTGVNVGRIKDSQVITMLDFCRMMQDEEHITHESKSLFLTEYMGTSYGLESLFQEEKVMKKEDHAKKLVLFLLREDVINALPEEMLYKYLIDLQDFYVIDAKEKIQYGLIDKEGEFPIGKFIVGTHTLLGEEALLL